MIFFYIEDKHSTAKKIKELFHGQTFYGNKLEVKTMGHRAKIWVGRLCPAVSNEYLQQAFETFGKVQRARVVAGSNGESAKWGFIEFDDPESAQKAVQTCDDSNHITIKSLFLFADKEVRFWFKGYGRKLNKSAFWSTLRIYYCDLY